MSEGRSAPTVTRTAVVNPRDPDPVVVLAVFPEAFDFPVHEPAAGTYVGVWVLSPGTVEDTMAGDETFVVVSGRATIEPVDGSAPFDIGPGDLCTFPAGYQSRWVVHEELREAYHLTLSGEQN